jgi:outer membrane protein assembly factor BamB
MITGFELGNNYLMAHNKDSIISYNFLYEHIKWSIELYGKPFDGHHNYFILGVKNKAIIESINKETGKSLWQVDLSAYMQPTNIDTPDLEQAFYDAQNGIWVLSISGVIVALDAATGQVKWDKVGFQFARHYEHDAAIGKLYFFEHISKHREQIVYYYAINLKNGDMSMIKEHTPMTMSIHKLLPKIKKGSETNISFVRIIGVREEAIYFAIRNLGLIYKADKTTGEILTTYNHKQPFRDGLIHDNYLFMLEYRKKAEENAVLIFEL